MILDASQVNSWSIMYRGRERRDGETHGSRELHLEKVTGSRTIPNTVTNIDHLHVGEAIRQRVSLTKISQRRGNQECLAVIRALTNGKETSVRKKTDQCIEGENLKLMAFEEFILEAKYRSTAY